jgi:hypothetical protein
MNLNGLNTILFCIAMAIANTTARLRSMPSIPLHLFMNEREGKENEEREGRRGRGSGGNTNGRKGGLGGFYFGGEDEVPMTYPLWSRKKKK